MTATEMLKVISELSDNYRRMRREMEEMEEKLEDLECGLRALEREGDEDGTNHKDG